MPPDRRDVFDSLSFESDRQNTCAIDSHDLLTVQMVPASIYKASWPFWIFAKAKLLEALSANHRLNASFEDTGGSWRHDQGLFGLHGFLFDPMKVSDAA